MNMAPGQQMGKLLGAYICKCPYSWPHICPQCSKDPQLQSEFEPPAHFHRNDMDYEIYLKFSRKKVFPAYKNVHSFSNLRMKLTPSKV